MKVKVQRWLSLFCLAILPFGIKSQDLLIWCDTCALSWPDFQGQSPNNTRFGAISTINFKSEYYTNNDFVKAEIYSYFIRRHSWVKSETNAGLLHEQGHFDLAEAYCRKFRKYLVENRVRKIFARRQMGRLYRKFNGEMADAQKKYDNETNFGADDEAQQKWNEWIQNELESLDHFSKTKIQIPYK